MKAMGHFKTITHHKLLVMGYCFRVGLIRQGLLHDLSKYSWTEFRIGAKYYTGTHSPNAAERKELGYSTAWLHHKGRNKHHLEYWTDYGGKDMRMVGQPMPTKYMVELCLDRIAACRVYHGKNYTDKDPLAYLDWSLDAVLMHPTTRKQVVEILIMLAEKGEKETLRYLRRVVLKHPVDLYPNLLEPADPGEKDDTFLTAEKTRELAETLGTPCYIYSEAEIQRACAELRSAFSWNPGFRQFFPVKATPTPGILRFLRHERQGVVCSSAAELKLCEKSGFSPEEILFMPNYATRADLDAAETLGCRLMMDSPELVEEYARRGMLREGIGLRLNPGGVFRFGGSEVRLESSKFGMTMEQAKAAIAALKSHGIRSVGVHSYFCGNTLEREYYPKAAEKLLELAQELQRDTGIKIDFVNLSGGLGIPYQPGQRALDLVEIGRAVQQVFAEKTAGTPLEGVAVHTELGRIITGPAGLLLTRVNHIRKNYRSFAGVDASAANLMRPMMYDAYHHISVAGKEHVKERQTWDVVGTVCENSDKFAEKRQLPELEVGDVLRIHDVGAHGHSMGYQYGGRLRCGEYLLRPDGSTVELRRPETTEDYLATAVF